MELKIKFYRNHIVQCVLLFILFGFLASVFLNMPLADIGQKMPQHIDAYLVSWIWSWEIHALTTNPANFFEANIFAPFHHTLAFTETMIGTMLLAWPILILSNQNIILAYNLVVLLTFAISGLGMYLLVFYLTKNKAAALLAALIYAFAPYKLAHSAGHLHLTGLWLPYVLLYLHKFFKDNTWRNILLLTLFITLVFLTGFHYFIFLPIAVIIFAIIYAASGKFRLNKNNLTKIIVSILILIAVAAPIVRPYLQARTDYGFTRSTQEIIDSSPAAVNYLISPFLNYYLYKIYDYKVQIISPGIAVIVLLLLSWYIFKRKKDAIGREHKLIYGFIIIIAFLVSLGFYLVLWPGQSLKVPGIYSLFYSFIPGFNGIRETGRYSIFVLLGICVFIGYGLNGWSQKIKDIYAKAILVLTVMMLFFLESSFVPSAVYLYPEGEGGSSEVIDLYEWVSKQPEDNIFLELPMGFKRDEYLTNYDIYYVFHSKDHFRKIVNGYSGYFPPGYIQLMDIMSSFNLEPGLRLIKKLGVNYLVFHFDRYDDPSQTKNIISEQADNSNSLRYVNNFGNNYVYQIIYD